MDPCSTLVLPISTASATSRASPVWIASGRCCACASSDTARTSSRSSRSYSIPSPQPASRIALMPSTPLDFSSRTCLRASSGVFGVRTNCAFTESLMAAGRCWTNSVPWPPSAVNIGPQTKSCAPSLAPSATDLRSLREASRPSPTLRAAVTPL